MQTILGKGKKKAGKVCPLSNRPCVPFSLICCCCDIEAFVDQVFKILMPVLDF